MKYIPYAIVTLIGYTGTLPNPRAGHSASSFANCAIAEFELRFKYLLPLVKFELHFKFFLLLGRFVLCLKLNFWPIALFALCFKLIWPIAQFVLCFKQS